jgi:hypothetical protein
VFGDKKQKHESIIWTAPTSTQTEEDVHKFQPVLRTNPIIGSILHPWK